MEALRQTPEEAPAPICTECKVEMVWLGSILLARIQLCPLQQCCRGQNGRNASCVLLRATEAAPSASIWPRAASRTTALGTIILGGCCAFAIADRICLATARSTAATGLVFCGASRDRSSASPRNYPEADAVFMPAQPSAGP